ncbi:MAG: hypothetical protein K8T89_16345 [Planctomycetes bacterium]|nr:hypothetical protein [Planctomycetota bacterium]
MANAGFVYSSTKPEAVMHNRKRFRWMLALFGAVALFSIALADRETPVAKDDPTKKLAALDNPQPRFWKGNLHTHTLWSDGDDFPEMVADWYKRHDYDFLSLTDHNILSEGDKWVDATTNETREQAVKKYLARFGEQWVEQKTQKNKALKDKLHVRLKPLREFRSALEEPGRFLMIPAEEISDKSGKLPVHINGINLRDVVMPLGGDSVAEVIRVNLGAVLDQQKRTGWRNLAFINHPNFVWGVRAEDMIQQDNLHFFEVYNGHPGVRNAGDETHASVERVWDILLAQRLGKYKMEAVYGVATDDAHGYHTFGVGKVNPGRGWVMVRAPHLTAEAIVAGLQKGDFYCSTGVTLNDFQNQKDEIRLNIKPEKGVTFKTEFIATFANAPLDSEPVLDKDGKPLTVTRIYSKEIGKVVAESSDLNPTYKMTGKELYVRAKITSSKPHPNPYAKGDFESAWTQPFLP